MTDENKISEMKALNMDEFMTMLKDQTALWGNVGANISEQDKKVLEYKEAVHGYAFKDTNINSIGVHSGTFHADEVVCIALAELGMEKSIEVIRSRDPEELKKADVCIDVGEGLLDHHGSRAMDRVSAITRFILASFNSDLEIGWDDDLTFSCKEGAIAALEIWNRIVIPVAAWDTGHADGENPFPEVHCICTHAVATDRDMDEAFEEAVIVVKRQVELMLETWSVEAKASRSAEEEIQKQRDDEVVVFHNPISRKAPVKQLLYKLAPKAVFYVSPESSDDWRVLCCCPTDVPFSNFGSRKLIPEKYRGLKGEELSAVTGLEGGIFCHAAGFIAGFKTLKAAEAFARKVLAE